MKKTHYISVLLILIAAAVILSGCMAHWPTSYVFTGQITGDTGAADMELMLNEDMTLSMQATIAGEVSGKWVGTWVQNKDGTVIVTFASPDSEDLNPAPSYPMSLNAASQAEGGMAGLSVTSVLSKDKCNSLTVKVHVEVADGFQMSFEGVLTQQKADT